MNTHRLISTACALLLAATLFLGCQTKEVTSAKVYQQQGNWDKMIEQLEQAVKTYPKDAEAYYLLGSAYGQKSNWEGLSSNFDKSLAIAPTFETQIKNERDKYWVTCFNNGVAQINTKDGKAPDLKTAAEQFITCTVIDPKRVDAYRNLAVTYMRSDNLQGAKESYMKLLDVDPKNVAALTEVSRLCMQMKDFAGAIDASKKALQLAPDQVDAVVNLALAYDMNGEREKALAEYQHALAKNPNDADLIFNMARLYFNSGEYDDAVELFQKVIAQNPDDYDANVNVGNSFLNMAEEVRKSLIEKEKNKQTVNDDEMTKLKGFYKQSIPYLEKALGIKGDNSTVWYNLGVAYINIGDAAKGKECFDKAESLRKQ